MSPTTSTVDFSPAVSKERIVEAMRDKTLPDADNDKNADPEVTSATDLESIQEEGSDSDDGSCISETSTAEWEECDHEPFETYQGRAFTLCRKLWPDVAAEDFNIERLKGGGYNRIIGLNIKASKPKLKGFIRRFFGGVQKLFCFSRRKCKPTQLAAQCILCVPRFDEFRLKTQVALTRFVDAQFGLPVPQILSYDTTKEHPLGQSYMVQNKIQGQNLESAWPTLNLEQKKSLVREFSRMLVALQSRHYVCAGILDEDDLSTASTSADQVKARQFEVPLRGEATDPLPDRSEPQTVLEMILMQLRRWRAHQQSVSEDFLSNSQLERLAEVATEMDHMGLFAEAEKEFYLTHLDLQPYNILITIQDNNTVRIAAILDWDSGVFGPKFLGCAPPAWLWGQGKEQDRNSQFARCYEFPLKPVFDADALELKSLFEETVSPEFLRYAYLPQYRLARGLCQIAFTGLWSDYLMDEANRIVEEWRALWAGSFEKREEFEEMDVDEENEDAIDTNKVEG